MSKWVKQAGVAVEVREPRNRVVVCDYGVEHRGDPCRCAQNEPDVPDPGKPGGFTVIRHGRRRPPRTADNKKSVAFAMTRTEARKNGLNPPVKSRRKPPQVGAKMWEMDPEQRRRAASRARS